MRNQKGTKVYNSLLNQFIKRPEFRKKQANWSSYRGERLFGEYHFGLRFGLTGNCTAWEKDFRVDYRTDYGTIDVKAIVDQKHNLLHPVNEGMCDIIVLAMVYVPLSLKNVDLIGWCHKEQLLNAPIREFSKEDPRKVDAHILSPSKLKPINELEVLFGLKGKFKDLSVELPHFMWQDQIMGSWEVKKPKQGVLF